MAHLRHDTVTSLDVGFYCYDVRVARPEPSCGCSPLLIPSPASRQRSSRVLPSAALTSSGCWKESGERWGSRQPFRWTQGSEFVSRDLDLWAYQRGVPLDFSRPGKPTRQRLHRVIQWQVPRRMFERALVHSLDDARRKCEAWRRDYNEERPHSAIGNRVPIELAHRSAALGPP